ncbi:MAG: hypothetical protein EOP55_18420 [Sphingobacteriales bacterium]|nr:MAG: hypothetical protein EOP55_18420 [Sphingobacteriales bacterium]
MKKIYASLFIVFIYINAGAQIVAWDFNGINGNENNVSATTVNMGLNTPKISRGNVTSEVLANGFNSKSWLASGSYTSAITNGSYCQFSIQPTAGFHMSISSITAPHSIISLP